MPKDKYMCQLCANHGRFDQEKKGHKQFCPFKNCDCNLCALNSQRRRLDQIERNLKKDGQELPADMLVPFEPLPDTKPKVQADPATTTNSSPVDAPSAVARPTPLMSVSARDPLPMTTGASSLRFAPYPSAPRRPRIAGQASIFHSAEKLARP